MALLLEAFQALVACPVVRVVHLVREYLVEQVGLLMKASQALLACPVVLEEHLVQGYLVGQEEHP